MIPWILIRDKKNALYEYNYVFDSCLPSSPVYIPYHSNR